MVLRATSSPLPKRLSNAELISPPAYLIFSSSHPQGGKRPSLRPAHRQPTSPSPSPSPSGPPSRINPSSVSRSMNAACSSHWACSRRSLVESQDGPLPWMTTNLVFMCSKSVTQPRLGGKGCKLPHKLNLHPTPAVAVRFGHGKGHRRLPSFLIGPREIAGLRFGVLRKIRFRLLGGVGAF